MALFLTLTMLFAMLAACTDKQSETTSGSGGAAATTEAVTDAPKEDEQPKDLYPLAEAVTLSLWNTVSADVLANIETMSNHISMKEASERTNIQLEIIDVSSSVAKDTFGIMIAGQDYPDMIKAPQSSYNTNGLSGAYANDIILDLTEYLGTYAPDYLAVLESDDTIMRNAKTDEGNILAFFTLKSNLIADFDGITIRYDLLEEMGMESPETYDEYYEVLTAFKTVYDMTDPLLLQWNLPMGGGINKDDAAFLIGGYNVAWAFYQVDGVVKYGPLEDNYYNFIKMLNLWYEEGLINADFYSRPDNPQDAVNQNILLTGQQGAAFLSTNDITGLPGRQVTGNDSYRITAVKDPTMDGTPHHLGNVPQALNTALNCLTITEVCENPEAAAMWANYWYSDGGSMLLNYGIESVTFEYKDGSIVFTDLMVNNPNELSFNIARQVYLLYTQIPGLRDMQNELSNYNEDAIAATDIWLSGYDNAWVLPTALSYTDDESGRMSSIKPDIATFNLERILAFIIGSKDLNEQSWAEYQETLISMDIESCIAIYQDALNRYFAR